MTAPARAGYKRRGMETPDIEIGADGIDVDAVVREIRETVARRAAEGAYADPRVARAERANLVNLQSDADFFRFYMDCLRDAVAVDINDFEIVERRRWVARPLVALKRSLWGLLRFYTYRLWSQQNQVNGLLFSALETLSQRYEQRIAELERRLAEREAPPPDAP